MSTLKKVIEKSLKGLELGGEIIDYEGDLRRNGVDKIKSCFSSILEAVEAEVAEIETAIQATAIQATAIQATAIQATTIQATSIQAGSTLTNQRCDSSIRIVI